MKHTLLHQLASIGIAAGVFFFVATFAHADTLTLPQQYAYPGLTFTNPLTFTQPISNPTIAIAFTSQKKLVINKADTNKPLESIVLTPTQTIIKTTSYVTPPSPTPTVYIQSPEEQVPTVTPTPQQTEEVTNTAATQFYTPTPQANTGGLNADDLFAMVNAYRASQGLPAFVEDAKTCSLAQVRAPEVAGEIAAGDMHAGLEAMNLPYWNTENIISMNSDQAAFTWWLNDPIHHAAIVSNNIYSCVACSGNSCAEEFTSYVAK